MSLQGKKIAILIAPRGTEEPEFAKPHEAVKQAGATVTVIGLEAGEAETVNNDLDPAGRYKVDRTIDGASAADYDGLVIPGGCVGADKLRASKDVVAFVRDFFAARRTSPSLTPVQSAVPMAPASHGSPETGATARMSARRLPAHCIVAVTVASGKRVRSSDSDNSSAGPVPPSTVRRQVASSRSGRSPCERT